MANKRLTRSQKKVLSVLTIHGCLLSTRIPELTQLAPRTVNFAIRELLKRNLIKRIPNLMDMRTVYYAPVDSFSENQLSVQSAVLKVTS